MVRPSARTGNDHQAAPPPVTTLITSAQGVESQITALSNALELRRSKAHTPLIAGAWHRLLTSSGLIFKYPTVPHGIQFGFDTGILPIIRTSTPLNKPSIQIQKEEFARIVDKEFSRGRYIGPLSRLETEHLIGPFQSSPMDLTPKPGQEGRFRLVQNLSFPHSPSADNYSINHNIDSDKFPCTWGTFSVICLLISRLPPGSQAAVWDVAEAYRTILVAPSQWPGLVIRLQGDDSFTIDTTDCFGLASSAGTYGIVTDIARAHGIGPMSKWVDDHIFFRICKEHMQEYNILRQKWNSSITANGGQIHDGSRLWYRGDTMPDDRPEEFDEDSSYPILDLSSSSPRAAADKLFTHSMEDIDHIYSELGVPWEATKDIPFSTSVPFIGFTWDIANLQVSIPQKKKSKYLDAIQEWLSRPTHTLEQVRKLYGKLLHACLVIPAGRAYLTNLEALLGISTIALSCHVLLLATQLTTFCGGQGPSRDRASSDQSPAPSPSQTSTHSLTQVQLRGLASQLVSNDVLGDYSQVGIRTGETSDGPKPSASNYSSITSSHPILRAATSKYTATTAVSSRDGGKGKVGTNLLTQSSEESIRKLLTPNAPSTPDTFPAEAIPQTVHPEVSTLHGMTSSRIFLSSPSSRNTSSTSTANSTILNSIFAEKVRLQNQPQNFPETQAPMNLPLPVISVNTGSKSLSGKRKHGKEKGRWGTEITGTLQRSNAPAAYILGLTPLQSSLRPHCLAKERLRLWKLITPRSLTNGQGLPVSLEASDLRCIEEILLHAWTDNTLELYGSGLLAFHVFCDVKAIPDAERAPASPITMSAFIAAMAGAYSGKTIANYLYRVRAWHILHGVPWQLNDPEVEALLKVADKLTPLSSKRKKRRPYTTDFIIAIRDNLDLDNPLDAAVYTCLTLTFYGAARVCEFTVRNLDAFDPTSHVKPSDVSVTQDRNGLEVTNFHISRTKSAPGGEDIFWARQNGLTDPKAAFYNHIRVNKPPFNGHLFAYQWKNGHRPLTKSKFILRLSQVAKSAGLDPLQGHGIRIGATLEYLLQGMPFDVMKVKGCWASNAFTLYLTKHAQIMAPYMQAVPDLHAPPFDNLLLRAQICSVSHNSFFSIFLLPL
jgi:hypothetical protein